MGLGFVTRKDWQTNPMKKGCFNFIVSVVLTVGYAVYVLLADEDWNIFFVAAGIALGWGVLSLLAGIYLGKRKDKN